MLPASQMKNLQKAPLRRLLPFQVGDVSCLVGPDP